MRDVVVREDDDVKVINETDTDYHLVTGGQGPAGVPGITPSYVFNQVSPLDTWVVNHNLGFKPVVEVFSTGGAEVEASILHISTNQTQIFFNLPFAGFARFV